MQRMGGVIAIIEGDSFSAIQWSSSKSSHLCRLAYLIEVVRDVSGHLGVVFHHMLREANGGWSCEGGSFSFFYFF